MQLSETISLTVSLACYILLLCPGHSLVLEDKLTPEDTLTPQQDSDPLSTACQQMCRKEDRQMMECAKRHGCAKILEPSEFHISAYKECMRPCFKVSSRCFSLCSENYNDMVSRCINIVGSVNEKMDCLLESFQEINTSKPLSTDGMPPTQPAVPKLKSALPAPFLRMLQESLLVKPSQLPTERSESDTTV